MKPANGRRRYRLIAVGILVMSSACGTERWIVSESANNNATAWPRYADKIPASTWSSSASEPSPSTSDAARAVVLLFPRIEPPQVLHWAGQENLRLVLTQTPASVVKTIPPGRPVGDLRTHDFNVNESVYAAIRCGFGRTWAGPPSEPKTYPAIYFCGPYEDVREARQAASSVVDDVLDDLREQAVNHGANVVSDIRCYLVKSPKRRLWCEATGEQIER